MDSQPDILCIGSVLWDLIGRANAHMRVGSDVPGRITRIPGGVVMNIAMALHAYGMHPTLLSAIGRDPEGEALIRACARLGMDTRYIYRSDDLPTDVYMAIEGGNGLIAAIADAHSLEAAGAKILQPLLSGALSGWSGLVAIDGNLTTTLLSEIAESPAFATADLRLAPASPGKAERLTPFLDHPTSTLYVNLEEAGLLLHKTFDNSQQAAAAFAARGVARTLVTDGSNRASFASGDILISKTPPEVVVTRITGAGDTFMAAHIVAEAKGAPPEMALTQALEAAATYISGETYR